MLHAACVCRGSFACRTGIILLLFHISSIQEALHLQTQTLHQPHCLTVSLPKCPGGLLDASASFQAVCQELECLLSASQGLRRQPVGWGLRVCFASIQNILFSPPALINYFLMCRFLPEKHWEFLWFWLWKRLKSWIRECLSERDLIDKDSAL